MRSRAGDFRCALFDTAVSASIFSTHQDSAGALIDKFNRRSYLNASGTYRPGVNSRTRPDSDPSDLNTVAFDK